MKLWQAFRDSFVGSFLVEVIAPMFLLLVPLLLLVMLVVSQERWAPSVPKCPEDAVLVGGGNYERGYWDYLYCADGDR